MDVIVIYYKVLVPLLEAIDEDEGGYEDAAGAVGVLADACFRIFIRRRYSLMPIAGTVLQSNAVPSLGRVFVSESRSVSSLVMDSIN